MDIYKKLVDLDLDLDQLNTVPAGQGLSVKFDTIFGSPTAGLSFIEYVWNIWHWVIDNL